MITEKLTNFNDRFIDLDGGQAFRTQDGKVHIKTEGGKAVRLDNGVYWHPTDLAHVCPTSFELVQVG